MSDLISRQAAIDALTTYIYNVYKVVVGKTLPAEDCGDAAESVIDELPTVQPEIIHCKECKYWKEKPLYTYCEKMYRMGILNSFDYATEENDFCSMAEKKGEAE